MIRLLSPLFDKTKELRRQLTVSSVFKLAAFSSTFVLIYKVSSSGRIGLLGAYYFDVSILMSLILLASHGLPMTALKMAPQLLESNNEGSIPILYKLMQGRLLFFSVLLMSAGFLVLYVSDFENRNSLALLCVAIPFQAAMQLNINFLRILDKSNVSEYLRLLHIPLTLLAFTVVLMPYVSKSYLLQTAHVFSSGIGCVVSLLLILVRTRKYTTYIKERVTDVRQKMNATNKSYFKMSLLTGINKNLVMILIGIFFTNTDVGLYGVVTKVMKLPTFVSDSLKVYLTPLISKFNAIGSIEGLRNKVQEVSLASFLINLPIWLTFFFAAPIILGLLGTNDNNAVILLRFFAAGQFLVACFGYNQEILSMTGHSRILVKILTYYVVFRLMFMFIVIEPFGYLGLAVVTICFDILRQVAILQHCNKNLKLNANIGSILMGKK